MTNEPVAYDILIGETGPIPIYIAREDTTMDLLIGEVHPLPGDRFEIGDPDHSLYGCVYPSISDAARVLADAHAKGVSGRDASHFAFNRTVRYRRERYE